jgi:hypothetical protein
MADNAPNTNGATLGGPVAEARCGRGRAVGLWKFLLEGLILLAFVLASSSLLWR